MTPPDQQQVLAAGRAYYERMCGNLASEGAQAASIAESIGIQLKAAQEEITVLKAENAKLKEEAAKGGIVG